MVGEDGTVLDFLEEWKRLDKEAAEKREAFRKGLYKNPLSDVVAKEIAAWMLERYYSSIQNSRSFDLLDTIEAIEHGRWKT